MSADDQLLADAHDRLSSLRDRLQQQSGVPVRLIETHISWLLLTEQWAYKLKKPLRLPFVDFRSLATRQHCCAEELRLNRRLAPAIYRDLVEVRQGPGGPDFDGTGPLLDVAVRMRRFADGSLWSERLAAGRLELAQVEAMARRLADFHDMADVMAAHSRYGSAAVHQRVTRGLVDATDGCAASDGGAEGFDWPPLRAWLFGQLDSLAAGFWDERRNKGRIREGHGDLHLANLLQQGDQSTAFDAIEFDAELRCIDVLEDIAFLVMDLLANRADGMAWRLLDVYLESSGDFAGLPGLRFYLVRRALVRAQVMDLSTGQASATASGCSAAGYRALASRLAFGADPRLAITHGLPASGKSFVAQQLLMQTGAIRLRSDVERKRLFDLGALEDSQRLGDIYTPQATEQTYQRLFELARGCLLAGWPVVVDAAFLRRAERANFAALAAAVDLPFAIVDCQASLTLLRERITRRQAAGNDPSEAGLRVLEALRNVDEALDADETALSLIVDAADPASTRSLARRWLGEPVDG